MLTADLVGARRRDGELVVRPLDAKKRAEAQAIAAALLDAARACEGRTRAELDEAWDAIVQGAERPKTAAGLRKLAEDRCELASGSELDPAEARREVFTRASAARRAGAFDRDAVLREAAAALATSPETVERALFSDRRSEHVLASAPRLSAAALVEEYELSRAQAVLLRAVRVTVDIRAAAPGPLRAVFSKMKFHGLLFRAERAGAREYRITIDGPMSMFDAVTRYGLRLALLVPALRALDDWSLSADVLWGKRRERLVFRMAERRARGASESEDLHVSDEVRALLEDVRRAGSAWRAEIATAILEVRGAGVCVPDLVLRHRDGRTVYVEVLGFWSRDAVLRRIDLAERGLGAPVVFAASSRLRVSPELLSGEVPAALYVYKGKMSARALLERVERVG